MPSPAASSRPTEITCPAVPIAVSRCPGSRLSAGVLYRVRPSGNSTLFCTRASRPRSEVSAAGASAAMRTTTVMADAATKRPAARAPSRAANIAARTGTASQAVDFRSQATPRATPEPTAAETARVAPAGRAARARASRISASTGGSVVITARLSPITGEATATAVASSASRRHDGTAPVRHRDPEGRRERDHRADGDPHPGVARQATEPGRARQPEQGHDRQVRVVGQPGGDLGRGQVRQAVVQQQRRGPVDDGHPVFERVGDRQPEQRREHGQRHRDSGGGGPAAPAPQHEQGYGIAARGPDGPDLVPAAGEDGGNDGVRREGGVRRHEVAPVEPGPFGLVDRCNRSGCERTRPAIVSRTVLARAVHPRLSCIVRVVGQLVPR